MQETADIRLGSSGSSRLHAMAQARVQMAALAWSVRGRCYRFCLSHSLNLFVAAESRRRQNVLGGLPFYLQCPSNLGGPGHPAQIYEP
jgi:hypothetical protein